MKRKNLNDVIHGDRATVRSLNFSTGQSVRDDWGGSFYRGDDYSGHLGSRKAPSKAASDFGPRCYESHPPLTLPNTGLQIYGGSCLSPAVKDADVYIGFDQGMRFTQRHWPWKKGTELLFQIRDMSAPTDAEEFKKLVNWTLKQLEAGLKVHCGCIGGHGRTGTFLAALVSKLGEKDAITYVRANYCKKAVEGSTQVKFLAANFGVTEVPGYKSEFPFSSGRGKSGKKSKSTAVEVYTGARTEAQFTPLPKRGSIWGD